MKTNAKIQVILPDGETWSQEIGVDAINEYEFVTSCMKTILTLAHAWASEGKLLKWDHYEYTENKNAR